MLFIRLPVEKKFRIKINLLTMWVLCSDDGYFSKVYSTLFMMYMKLIFGSAS